ncbi:hypothetical protein INR49_031421 [Caranx melampygus]|nr:hypothetical protein INR49_031421 [Caranx melampygus]
MRKRLETVEAGVRGGTVLPGRVKTVRSLEMVEEDQGEEFLWTHLWTVVLAGRQLGKATKVACSILASLAFPGLGTTKHIVGWSAAGVAAVVVA